MKPLANFIMRGYSQAALVASVSALLSLILPLLGLVSSATIGLVTLRKGVASGLLLVVLATFGTGIFATLALGAPWVALGVLVLFWVPLVGLGAVLRSARSLDLTVQLAGLGGVALVLAVHALVGDAAAYWQQLLEPLRESLVTDGLVSGPDSQVLFAQLARWMTGAFAAGLVFQYLIALFISRWWQAALFNQGGFGEEFRALRLGRLFGLAVLVLAPLPLIFPSLKMIGDVLPVLGGLLILQGLAVAHAARALFNAGSGWLIGLYGVLVLLMPQTGLLLACVGLADIWADFRARLAQRAAARQR